MGHGQISSPPLGDPPLQAGTACFPGLAQNQTAAKEQHWMPAVNIRTRGTFSMLPQISTYKEHFLRGQQSLEFMAVF